MVAADVYAHPMHVGRGGWTWYTGSAGWMYQAAVRAILGLERRGRDDQHQSLHPDGVDGVHAGLDDRRHALSLRHCESASTGHAASAAAELDGVAVDPAAIPLHRGRPPARGAGRAGQRRHRNGELTKEHVGEFLHRT